MDWSTDKNILDEFIIFFTGKNIGILGPDSCGKTVFYTLILEKKIKETTSTDTRESSKRLNIAFFDNQGSQKCLRIKLIFDVAGQRDIYKPKEDTFNTQEYIIYFLRSDLVMPPDREIVYRDRDIGKVRKRHELAIKQDFSNMGGWEGKNRKLIIVGNHFGQQRDGQRVAIPWQGEGECLVPNFLDEPTKNNYQREFRGILTNMISLNKFSEVKWVVGSFASDRLGNQLALDIFRCLI